MKLPVDVGLSDAARARLEALLAPPAQSGPRRALPDADQEIDPYIAPGDPEPVQPARCFGRRHLTALAVVLALGVALAAWNLVRARPVEVTPATVVGAVSSASSSPSARSVVVHVAGAVLRPGVVTLPGGARVQDALEAAGGLTPDADAGDLNLAAVLSDGAQIVIGTRGAPAGEVRSGGGTSSGAPGTQTQLDLNTATQAQLEALPGVGPVTAGKIVAWRTQHGRFNRVEELGEVDGIGPKTLAQLTPHVRV